MRKRKNASTQGCIWFFMFCLFSTFSLPGVAFAVEQPVKGGTLIWARSGDSLRLDLAQTSDLESVKVSIQVMETLTTFGLNDLEVKPLLATSWKLEDDGLTWTFKLRKGVKFHDGTPFTAQAVKDSYERVIRKDHPFYGYGKWSVSRMMLSSIKEVVVIDDYTVAIVTKYPYVALPNTLAEPFCNILSPKAMEELKEQIINKPVGTGPFKFVKWVRDDHTILERNEEYWGKKAYLDKIIIKVIPEPSARLMSLQTGLVDMADDLDPDSILLVKEDTRFDVLERIACGFSYVALNCERPPLNKTIVRQAINYAVDKPTLVKSVFQGMAIPATNPMPPVCWGYNDDIVPYEYNPVKSKELLEKAGLGKGFEVDFLVLPMSRPYMPEPLKVGELIQAYLREVGIKAKIVRLDWGGFAKRLYAGDFDMIEVGWLLGTGDPDSLLFDFLSGTSTSNRARWKNPEYTGLVEKARRITDKAERTRLYLKAQEIFHEDIPWIPLTYPKIYKCYNKRLKNVPLRPIGVNSYEMIWKEK